MVIKGCLSANEHKKTLPSDQGKKRRLGGLEIIAGRVIEKTLQNLSIHIFVTNPSIHPKENN
jgi:hypothetical protein